MTPVGKIILLFILFDTVVQLDIYSSKGKHLGVFEVEQGKRLFNAIVENGVDIINKCATKATCARCVIEYIEGEPDTYTAAEQKLIFKRMVSGDVPEITKPSVRASCQIRATHNMKFRIIYHESEVDFNRSDKAPADKIEPEPTWITGKPSRVPPQGYDKK